MARTARNSAAPPRPARPRPARGPGRPRNRDPELVRAALLEAARRHIAAHGVTSATLRAIAREAGVTSAMVHYHFGDKQGLLEAMLTETVGPVMRQLGDAVASSTAPDLTALLRRYVTTLAANPWLPQLLVREVFAEGGAFRERFIAGFAARGSGLLIALIKREQAAGRMRRDLDPRRTAQALLSLALFPFIALPVTREVFGMQTDPAFLERHIADLARLFEHGARVDA